MCQQSLANFSIHIQIDKALNLANETAVAGQLQEQLEIVDIWHSGIVLATISFVITILSRPELNASSALERP